MNQHRLWNSHAVRAERREAAEVKMGRRMELDLLPGEPPPEPTAPAKPKRSRRERG